MEKFLFLDFDGVLFDTVDEAYNICINTNMFKGNNFTVKDLELFKKYRFLVGPAWNYYFIMNSIINNDQLIDSSKFIKTDNAMKFESDFFSTRKTIKEDNYTTWLKLNKKYYFLDKLVEILDKRTKVYIISTKDKDTVIDLLMSENITFIKSENILGKDSFNKYGTKKEIILSILKNKKYNAIFIDDLSEHLLPCESIESLRLIQANWGYVNSEDNYKYLMNEHDTLTIIENLFKEKK